MECIKIINQKRKQLKTSLLFIILTVLCFAQNDKGYIDMHGGKPDSLSGKMGDFSSNMNLNENPFAKKTNDQHIPIDKIGTVKEVEEPKEKKTKGNK